MLDELLTVQEVAGVLKLNQQTVRNMVDRGDLAAVRVGSRRVRFRRSELDNFLEAGSQATEAPAAEVDEGSITVWAAFGAAMAEAASALDDPAQLARALDRLSAASSVLAVALRSNQP